MHVNYSSGTLQQKMKNNSSGIIEQVGDSQYLLAWSVGFINFPLLVEEVERRPMLPVRLLHLVEY